MKDDGQAGKTVVRDSGDVTPAAAQRIEQIVHQAAKLFDKVGYHAANMEMVAKATGFRKPTLYHYVRSKEEILFRMHQWLIDSLNEQHRARVAQGQSREELLYGLCKDILHFIAENRGFVRAFFEHNQELSEAMRKEVRQERAALFALFTDLIADGVKAGEYHTHEVTLSALFLLGQCNWAYQWYRPGQNPPPEALARMMLDTFLYGIAGKRPARASSATGSRGTGRVAAKRGSGAAVKTKTRR